tara:strand:+ start:748 stop:1143 length:396 start_codon:yes stop_codon:yes gene_type:complete
MSYNIKNKFANSPLPCWSGYERVPGTTPGTKGSCRKSPSMYNSKSPIAAIRKTKSGANLKRWFKEEWKDEKGNVCGSDKNKNTKVCRPSKRVSSNSPKPWKEMSRSEKNKVISAKKKVGMGRRRSSKSNVS